MKKSIEDIMNSLTEKQIKEFMQEYNLSYEKAKKGLAEYIYFSLYEDKQIEDIVTERIECVNGIAIYTSKDAIERRKQNDKRI